MKTYDKLPEEYEQAVPTRIGGYQLTLSQCEECGQPAKLIAEWLYDGDVTACYCRAHGGVRRAQAEIELEAHNRWEIRHGRKPVSCVPEGGDVWAGDGDED